MVNHHLPNFTPTALRSETDIPIEWFAIPSPRLAPYILGYRGLILPTQLPTPFTQLVAPSASAMLYIVFGVQATTEIALPGSEKEETIGRPNHALILPSQRQWGARISASADVVGVVFRPGKLMPFLNLSLHEFDDGWIDPTELWMHTVSNQLAESESLSPRARVAAIESALITQLQKSYLEVDPLIVHAVDSIERSNGNLSLDLLADRLGISLRQLRRKFRFHVGMSPKQFGRIERFRKATEFAFQNYPAVSLASIAQQFGYFDQAHFARDVIEFTGQTPKGLALSDQQVEQAQAVNLYYFDFAASS